MTDTKQHQMPTRHVVDNVEKAIQAATDAEMAVRHAQLESDPNKLASALGQLQTAQRTLENAQSQLNSRGGQEYLPQELERLQGDLTQAVQSLDITASNTQQPKQVR